MTVSSDQNLKIQFRIFIILLVIGWLIIFLLTAFVFYVIYNNVKNNLARVSTKAKISFISTKYNLQSFYIESIKRNIETFVNTDLALNE